MIEIGKKVLETEGKAILKIAKELNKDFSKAVKAILEAKGRVVLTGIGKSGLIAQKIAATLTSTGTPSLFMHAAEAVHGELGSILPQDIVIALSYSGETSEVKNLLEFLKRNGNILISITGNANSTLAKASDIILPIIIEKEACPIGLVPTTSTTAMLSLGDAIAVALMVEKGFSKDDFAYFHPGGKIGKKIMKVKHLMHKGEELPLCYLSDNMEIVIKKISDKKFGVAIIIDDLDNVKGIITDGDLRRAYLKYGKLDDKKAVDCMHKNPILIEEEEIAVKALNIMENRKITSIIVADINGKVKGLIHLHDLWRTQMF
jgi:arabinose-5-phosphate isomerase